ncbi:MAG: tRNA (cytidine(34)-2'-O)-methyltransferase [Malacoplasma sp.]|nr:tRNA (cytidine(34)-2'-O)-methyltransferase [Malacoplasma sp.]
MLHIVLYQPQIPENTGNISRTCIGLNAKLHLIRPYGFILSDKRVIRAGLDYWKHLNKEEHDDWYDFETKNNLENSADSKLFLITKFGYHSLSKITKNDLQNSKDIFLVFGSETKGLDDFIKQKYANQCLKIEMGEKIRCFNLSNSVAIVAYMFHYLTDFKYF